MGQREHLDVSIGLGERERIDRIRRTGGIGKHRIHDGLIRAAAIGRQMNDRCGDRIAVRDDGAMAGLDKAAERDERVAAGHDAGVDEERDRAVRGGGRARRGQRGRATPQCHPAAGDRLQVAGEVGPHWPRASTSVEQPMVRSQAGRAAVSRPSWPTARSSNTMVFMPIRVGQCHGSRPAEFGAPPLTKRVYGNATNGAVWGGRHRKNALQERVADIEPALFDALLSWGFTVLVFPSRQLQDLCRPYVTRDACRLRP